MPENIEEFIASNGYEALGKALTEMTPEGVIDVIEKSGLQGRGGAGFPAGRKWKFVRAATVSTSIKDGQIVVIAEKNPDGKNRLLFVQAQLMDPEGIPIP